MKIIELPCETRVKCELCGCIYDFDNTDVCMEREIIRNLEGNIIKFPLLYVTCPFCGTKHPLLKENKDD